MLDDYREVFAAALFRLGFDINTTDDAELDQALAAAPGAEAAAADLHDRRHRRAVDRRRLDHARLGRRRVPGVRTSANGHVLPARGGRRPRLGHDGPARRRAAPGRGAPVHQLHARRAGRADNTNYIGYMGPNEAAKEFIDPAILADPTVNPDKAIVDTLAELLDLGRRREVPGSLGDARAGAWQTPRSRRPSLRRGSAAGRRRRSRPRCCPGSAGWSRSSSIPLGIILVVSLGHEGPLRRRASSTRRRSTTTRARFDPGSCRRVLNSLKYALRRRRSCALVIAYPMAYFISRYGGRRKALLLVLVMLPFWTS